jgi:hypothetical protein
MSNQNLRQVVDANLSKTTALPAANASNISASIPLNSGTAGRIPAVELHIALPATPSLVDAKNITLTVKDSADGVTFNAVADIPVITVTGAGGVGAAAVDRRFKLPIGIRNYIALAQAVDNAGGDSTAISSTFELVF